MTEVIVDKSHEYTQIYTNCTLCFYHFKMVISFVLLKRRDERESKEEKQGK